MLLGYLEFIALLFLPGAAFIEIFRLGGDYSFAERLGLAFGLSMAIDVLALAFRTSGIVVGSFPMFGIYPGTLEAMLGVSALAFVVPIAFRRQVTFYVKATRADLYLLGLVLAQAVLVLAHFSKYPIFPEYQSSDFMQHVDITMALQSGSTTLLPGGLLYYGVHLLMGSLLALSGDLPLTVTQYAMGILTAFSPLLVYAAVTSLTKSSRTGLVATLFYVATGFVWFGSVFDAGLYPNFYGILSILLIFALIPAVLASPRRPGIWIAFVVAIANGYFSHYTFVTVLPALFAIPVAAYAIERKVSWAQIAVPVVAVLPAVASVAADPNIVALLVSFVTATGGGSITGNTLLSQYLTGWPVLRFIVDEITNDTAAVTTLALAAAGVYFAFKDRQPLVWILVAWLVALLVAAPVSATAWRFSYMALVPLLLLASLAFERLIPRTEAQLVKRSKMRSRRDARRNRLALLAVLSLLLIVGSWSWSLAFDALSNASVTSQTQGGILASMKWINSTLPLNAEMVSATNFDYNYFSLVYPARVMGYAPEVSPQEVVQAASGSTVPTYVVLTRVATFAGVPAPSQNPLILFPDDSAFKLVYNQTGVLIYQLQG